MWIIQFSSHDVTILLCSIRRCARILKMRCQLGTWLMIPCPNFFCFTYHYQPTLHIQGLTAARCIYWVILRWAADMSVSISSLKIVSSECTDKWMTYEFDEWESALTWIGERNCNNVINGALETRLILLIEWILNVLFLLICTQY